MKFKISLLVMLVGIIGIWFSVDAIAPYTIPGQGDLTPELENEVLNLGYTIMIFATVETVGVIMSIYYGIKAANKSYNKWADKRDERKQKTAI